jgi:purine-binding chemotaxis protein CheW
MNLVSFHVRGQWLGCEIQHVKETIVLGPLTRVFLTPPWVAGIISLRGDVVAVLDLGLFVGLAPIVPQPDTRIVIVRRAARSVPDERVAGLLVDKLADVRAIDPDTIASPPPTLAPELGNLLGGISTMADGTPLAILDLAKLFDSERLQKLSRRT